LGVELEEREAARERLAEVALGVIGAAEVRAGDVGPADNELAALELLPLAPIEAREIGAAVRRDHQPSAGAEHAVQLVAPAELELVGQVREDGEGIDEIEAVVLDVKSGCEPVLEEGGEVEVLAAPVDRLPADVAAGDGAVEVRPVPRDAAAAAAEVEDGLVPVERHVGGDRVVG